MLVYIGRLTTLEKLNLLGTKVTGAGLANLRPLEKLTELCLVQTAVDDAGLANLDSLTSLKKLTLESSKISDDGLPHLAKLTKLEVLSIHNGTRVTGAGIRHLRPLTNSRRFIPTCPSSLLTRSAHCSNFRASNTSI